MTFTPFKVHSTFESNPTDIDELNVSRWSPVEHSSEKKLAIAEFDSVNRLVMISIYFILSP